MLSYGNKISSNTPMDAQIRIQTRRATVTSALQSVNIYRKLITTNALIPQRKHRVREVARKIVLKTGLTRSLSSATLIE